MTDRRRSDRRQSLLALRFPDRRRGFPRRTQGRPLRYTSALAAVRDRPTLLALLATLLLALNVADLTLTQRALGAGAFELNPVMAALFEIDAAAAVKLILGATVVGSLWVLRRYRAAIGALVWMCVGMGMLVTYQVLLLAAIA